MVETYREFDESMMYEPPTNMWTELTDKQMSIMMVAAEEGYVVEILDTHRARALWAETGDTRTPSDLDDSSKQLMMHEFATVVHCLANRGYLEVLEHLPGGAEEQLIGSSLDEALRDPASWISNEDCTHRVLELRTGAVWNDQSAVTARSENAQDGHEGHGRRRHTTRAAEDSG